jgi:hypothetical protein
MSSEQPPLPIHRQPSNPPAKPVPDVDAFQRVLAAVYTLQQYHDRLVRSSAETVPEATSQGDDKSVRFIHSVSSFPKATEPLSVTDVENEREPDVESWRELDHAEPAQQAQLITWPAPADVNIFPELERPQVSRRAAQIAVFAVAVLLLIFGALLMSHRQAKSGVAHAGSDVNQKLASEVSARIHGERRLHYTPLQISAGKGGIITLSGEVGSAADRVLASRQASKVQGVRVVIDNLRVQDPDKTSNAGKAILSAQVAGNEKTSRTGVQTGGVDENPGPLHRQPTLDNRSRRSGPSDITVHSAAIPGTARPSKSASIPAHPSNSASIAEAAHSSNQQVAGARVNASVPKLSTETPKQVTVPSGTVLAVQLSESLSSDLNHQGDTFSARLVSPIMVGNQTVIPANATVQGEIVEVQNAGHFNGASELVAKVTRLTFNGKTYRLRSSEFSQKSAARDIQTAEVIGGGAGVGAILGAILGGTKGAAVGVVLGAGVGTGVRVMSKPKQIELPAQSTLSFRLETPLTLVPVSRG